MGLRGENRSYRHVTELGSEFVAEREEEALEGFGLGSRTWQRLMFIDRCRLRHRFAVERRSRRVHSQVRTVGRGHSWTRRAYPPPARSDATYSPRSLAMELEAGLFLNDRGVSFRDDCIGSALDNNVNPRAPWSRGSGFGSTVMVTFSSASCEIENFPRSSVRPFAICSSWPTITTRALEITASWNRLQPDRCQT